MFGGKTSVINYSSFSFHKCNQGDSGGPLVCKEGRRYVLRGAVSWGNPRCDTNFFTVFARVSNYVQWINRKMRTSGMPPSLSVYLSVRQSVSQLVSLSPFLSVSHSLCFFSISPSRSLRLFKKTHQINISPSKYLYSFKYHSTTSRSGEGLERT